MQKGLSRKATFETRVLQNEWEGSYQAMKIRVEKDNPDRGKSYEQEHGA